MLRRIVLSLTALLAAAAHAAPQLEDGGLSLHRVAQELALPTTLAFLAPNDFLVLEKDTGLVQRVTNGVVQPAPVLDLAVNGCGERGLLGIAVHPELGAGTGKDWVYLYYTASSSASDQGCFVGPVFVNRLERFELDGNALVDPLWLLDLPSFASNHNGGPLVFGPDGMLYGVMGDGGQNDATQNNENLANLFQDTGVIFRLDEDGVAPASNPFFTEEPELDLRDAYFAYGVRNSFGLAFDPFTEVLWDTENGPGEFDEINRIVPGANSGWRDVMGPASLTPGFDPVTDLVHLPGSTYIDPEYSIVDTVAPTGLAFASEASTLGAAYEESLFVADVNLGNVYEFPLTAARDGLELGDRVADDQSELDGFLFASGFEGISDLEEGPDGDLYVVAIGLGEVWRISGAPGGGGAPVHDLAIAKVKAPKKISLSDEKPVVMKDLKLTLVNQGTATETIDDLAELTNLVSIDWTSLPGPNGPCDAPATEPLEPKKGFPVVLAPRKKLNVSFAVTWDCANDDAKSTKTDPHADFELVVTLDHAAVDGGTDSDPSDDVCPRPPSGADRGCGAKGGGAIRTDVVRK